MANLSHTPGPWEYRNREYDDWGVVRAGNCILCQVRDPNALDEETLNRHRRGKTDPWEANARLVSAAPDLLEALEALLAHPGTHHTGCIHWHTAGCDCEFAEVANTARAAIAKASPPPTEDS